MPHISTNSTVPTEMYFLSMYTLSFVVDSSRLFGRASSWKFSLVLVSSFYTMLVPFSLNVPARRLMYFVLVVGTLM